MDNGWWWWSVVSGGGGNFILSTSCVGYTPVVGCVAPMCRDGYGFFYSIEPAQSVKSRWYRCGWDVVLQRWIKLKVLTPDQLMPLPLTVSCFSKIQIGFTFLVPAHPGSPWQGPLNGCVGVCVFVTHCWVSEVGALLHLLPVICPAWALGRNVPWFDFWSQRYMYCLLVYIVCFPTYPLFFTFFLLISSLTYLFLWE